MFADKPIIGIVGGIGSGKSFVAGLFGQLGCLVINSDEQVAAAYERSDVRARLREWWGDEMITANGAINRRAIASRVFADEAERRRLEGLLYPIIARMRDERMRQAAKDPAVKAYVWDAPLLIEAGLAGQCDAIVYVDAPWSERLERVRRTRGWDEAELTRREKLQLPLDKKREIANDMVRNAADVDDVRSQVREVLSRILAGTSDGGKPRQAPFQAGK